MPASAPDSGPVPPVPPVGKPPPSKSPNSGMPAKGLSPLYGFGYGHGYSGYVPGYPVSVHPPHHMFNDENPNACAIM